MLFGSVIYGQESFDKRRFQRFDPLSDLKIFAILAENPEFLKIRRFFATFQQTNLALRFISILYSEFKTLKICDFTRYLGF